MKSARAAPAAACEDGIRGAGLRSREARELTYCALRAL